MSGTSLKILVVDDDRDAADSLAELFELEDHTVTVAYSGEEAIKAYQTVEFDVAFMDVMMPGKNGVESFLEIRSLKPDAQVYMMTGYSVEQLVQQAIDHGAMGVLDKPVEPTKVLNMLSQVKPAGILLIAEDDPDVGEQLETIISGSGFECSRVQKGADALKRINKGNVDVLILDLNRPVIDGIEVYSDLQRQNKAVPTIIISGNGSHAPGSIDLIRDMSVTGVLHKPFDPSCLLTKLEEFAA